MKIGPTWHVCLNVWCLFAIFLDGIHMIFLQTEYENLDKFFDWLMLRCYVRLFDCLFDVSFFLGGIDLIFCRPSMKTLDKKISVSSDQLDTLTTEQRADKFAQVADDDDDDGDGDGDGDV